MVAFRSPSPVNTGTTRAIIENAFSPSPIPWGELAHRLGIQNRSLYRRVNQLRKQGRIPKPSGPVTMREIREPSIVPPPERALEPIEVPESPSKPKPEPIYEKLLAEASAEGPLDAQKRRKILDYLALNAPSAVQVAAIKLAEELERYVGTNLGPPDPQTDDEITERLGRQLLAAGPALTSRALAWAKRQAKLEEEALRADSAQQEDPPAPEGGEPADGGGGVG